MERKRELLYGGKDVSPAKFALNDEDLAFLVPRKPWQNQHRRIFGESL